MSVEANTAMLAILKADATVLGHVGGSIEPRIYANAVPSNIRQGPYIVFRMASEQRDHVMNAADALVGASISVLCAADRHSIAEDLQIAARKAIDTKTGTYGGVTVRRAFVNGVASADVSPFASEELGEHDVVLDTTLWYEQEL